MPKEDRRKVAERIARKCVRVLKERFGAKQAFVIGSLRGDGPWHGSSDIDIAVEGLPPGRYIEALAALWELLPKGLDLDLIPLERAPSELVERAQGGYESPGGGIFGGADWTPRVSPIEM